MLFYKLNSMPIGSSGSSSLARTQSMPLYLSGLMEDLEAHR